MEEREVGNGGEEVRDGGRRGGEGEEGGVERNN